jgi:hypothetical protein
VESDYARTESNFIQPAPVLHCLVELGGGEIAFGHFGCVLIKEEEEISLCEALEFCAQ